VGVEVCLDSAGTLCSANSGATGQFCSYHGQVGGLAYVVQPWTIYTSCDEPSLPVLPANPTPQQLETDAGVRLVSPLSQGQIAAIVNPFLGGWFATGGAEVNDNHGCHGLGPKVDTVPVGGASYVLQREWTNAAAIAPDPYTYFGCALDVPLAPAYVVPSAVNAGDVVEFDGSGTVSGLLVSRSSYGWSFGDGSTAVGPSVEHTYAQGGNYTVTLTVTDRGGNAATLSQTAQVLGAGGQPVGVPPASGKNLHVRIQLLPQGLRAVLHKGLMVRVSSNERADGIASVLISRALARRAHIKVGRRPFVVVGVGTLSGIKNGTVRLHLRFSPQVAAKLAQLGHVTLTVRLALVGAGGNRLAVDAAGRY
jgi:hypothetical protein